MMLHLLSLSKCIHPSYTYKALPTIANAYFRLLSDKGKKDGDLPKSLGSACNTQNEPPKTLTCKKDELKLVDSACKEITASCKKDGDKPKKSEPVCKKPVEIKASCKKDDKPKKPDCKKPTEKAKQVDKPKPKVFKTTCIKDEKPKDCKKPVEVKPSCKKEEKPKECKKVKAPCPKKEEKPKECKKPVEAKAPCKKEEKPKECKKVKAPCPKKEEKPKECKKPVEAKAPCKKEEKPKTCDICKKPKAEEISCKKPKADKGSCGGGQKKCPTQEEHQSASTWKKISLFGCIPLIALLTGIVFGSHHEQERAEFKNWEHMYRRTKPFFFNGGPGNKSYYHNPHLNALPPLGYEDEVDMEANGEPEETLLEKAERYLGFESLRREWKKKKGESHEKSENVRSIRAEMNEKATRKVAMEKKNKKKAEDIPLKGEKDMDVKTKEMEYVPLEEDEDHVPTK